MSPLKRLFTSGTIQSRLLTIALVPSIAALLIGVAVSGYLVNHGLQVSSSASKVADSSEITNRYVIAMQTERRLTLQWMSDRRQPRAPMDKAREDADVALAGMDTLAQRLADGAPQEVVSNVDDLRQKIAQIKGVRNDVNTGGGELTGVYDFYNRLVDSFAMAIRSFARSAPDATMAYEQLLAADLVEAADAMSRGHALAAARVTTGMTPEQFHEYIHQIGAFHDNLNSLTPRMTPQEKAGYKASTQSPAWKQLDAVQKALEAAGGQSNVNQLVRLPVSTDDWENAAGDLATQLDGLYKSHTDFAASIGNSQADATLVSSITGGVLVLALAGAVFVIAYRLSQLLIRRLTRLREETLSLSDEQLPGVLDRLRQGDKVDVETEVAWLDHGDDEIGQVANAFNKAQRQAIGATVQESETRQGVRSVFLNIAHRSQVMVHRQLKVLDQAERSQEDPDQLELLFQLDHLATQSRRNAENLIILGGQRPGRQWRNPVTLLEIVRGAVAETEQYARVEIKKLPELELQGMVVADLIHLLAELVDNATSFSPPESHVEVSGGIVGRGIVIEVEDQGLGIEPDQLESLNAMLRTPPDFSVMALSSETRMGLFVVAQLAARHGIKITLRDSAYGGIRALVLVPRTLVADRDNKTDQSAGGAPQESAPEQSQPRTPAAPSPQIAGHIYNDASGHNEAASNPLAHRLNGHAAKEKAKEAEAGHSSADTASSTAFLSSPAQTNGYSGRTSKISTSNLPPSNESSTPPASSTMDRTRPAMQIPQLGDLSSNGTSEQARHSHQTRYSEPARAEAPPQDTSFLDTGQGLVRPSTPASNGDKPPLPRRRRQENIAAPLRDDPPSRPEPPQSPSAEQAPPRTADRSRMTMAAFQKGTKRARTTDSDANATPRPRGDEG